MKKLKPVILISIINAVIFSIISIWIFEGDWPFLSYLLLAGFFMVAVQVENISYKFLDKLLIGSLFFGFLTMFFIFLRMYAMSYFVYNSSLPFSFWYSSDMLMMAAVFSFVSFLGGLLGIVIKGFYFLYKNKLDIIIVFIAPLFIMLSSLAIIKVKIGGTIMSVLHGWPYPFLIHQIKDVVDGFSIDKWIFSLGSFYHYIIFDYLFYLIIFLLFYYLIKLINKKLKTKKINTTIFLFGLLVFIIILFTSFLPIKKSYILRQITRAGYCETNSDCAMAGTKCPFSCAIAVNHNEVDYITNLVHSFPSTCEFSCPDINRAICLDNKCRFSIEQASDSNNDLWQKIKQSINNCEVSSIMQTHSMEVTAVLKTGEVINAIEPKIDDIFDIVGKAKEKCGKIIMMTE